MKRLLALVVLALLALATAVPAVADFLTQEGFATQANGGGIQSDDGLLDWGVPPQASDANLRLWFQEQSPDGMPAPLRGGWIGQPFNAFAYNFDTGSLVNTSRPMTMNFHYSDSQLMGFDVSTLQFVRLVGTGWVALPTTVDPVSHIVFGTTTDSGTYGLLVGGGAQGSSGQTTVIGRAAPPHQPRHQPLPQRQLLRLRPRLRQPLHRPLGR